MIDLHEIRDNIGNMVDSEILRRISAGREGYIDGVYNLYLQEAIQRNLDISESNIEHIQFQIAIEEDEAEEQYFTSLGWHSYFSPPFRNKNGIYSFFYYLVRFLIH
jgi:hypothetical protein